MRVLHVGNIANNAYNNAKFLRRRGITADVLCYDYKHIMGQPEWEDAEFEGQPDEFDPKWEQLDVRGFCRPSWFFQDERSSWPLLARKQWFKGQSRLERLLQRQWCVLGSWRKYLDCRADDRESRLCFSDIQRVYPDKNFFARWFQGYDMIQAYSTEAIHAWLFSPGRPYVAFEHGTMREIPFEHSARGRLLAFAYRRANRVLITNPDVLAAAQRLGLNNFQFIPHPVDETKYRPGPSGLRNELVNRCQTDLILFAPSRHNWALKGNDQLLRAFARCLKESRNQPVLILSRWGQEVERSERLIADLGIAGRVLWCPPLNKMKLIAYYNAADVVLDQFTLGTFGTVTPEAMACGRPVVLHFDRAIHEWCYTDMPPVVSAKTEGQIFRVLMDLLGDPGLRSSMGQASREWMVKHHGWELVADRQIAVYRELLQQ